MSDPLADGQPIPWERLEDETARAYAAFCVYRDAGPTRSLRTCADAFYAPTDPDTGRPQRDYVASAAKVRNISEWSRVNSWVSRAHSWDAHLDETTRIAKVEAAKEMRTHYAQLGRTLRQLVGRAAANRIQQGLVDMSPSEMARLIEVAQKVEAWAREVPDRIQRIETIDLTELVEKAESRLQEIQDDLAQQRAKRDERAAG